MIFSLQKFKELVEGKVYIISMHGTNKTGIPKSPPPEYLGLSWGQQLVIADSEDKSHVKVFYKVADDTQIFTKTVPISTFQEFVESPSWYIGKGYYLIYTSVGILAWETEEDGLSPVELAAIIAYISEDTGAAIEDITIYSSIPISKHTHELHWKHKSKEFKK